MARLPSTLYAPSLARMSAAIPSVALLFGLLSLPACGDDGDGDGSTVTGLPGSDSSTTDPGTSEDTSTSTAPGGSGSSGAADSESSGDGGSTTGSAEDPNYPNPQGGMCDGGTAPVMLPGAQVCSPFCTGRGDPCPAGATGDAPPECTPFLGDGGSGDPCDEMTPCPGSEACSPEGTCGEVAFWACQLVCAEGQACPDGMVCSGIGTCGYP